MRNRRYLALAVVGVIGASCGFGSSAPSAATTTSTTVSPVTTTTNAPDKNISPLTGLPYSNLADAKRPAILAKIDNAPQAWPQSGLLHSDVIYEEMVEGGYTRYMLVLQSQDASVLGPIRSVRASDADIASPLAGFFAYSGGIPAFVSDIRNSGITDVGAYVLGGAYYRTSRPAPHNLYTSTTTLYTDARRAGLTAHLPPKLFQFRKTGTAFSAAGAQPISTFNVDISGNANALWIWDAAKGFWTRTTNGVPQRNPQGVSENATNVIIEFVNYTNTGFVDPAGNPVPQAHSVGTGNAVFLSGGQEATGTWSKASEHAVTTFTDSAGQPVKLAPGRTWVEFAPIGTRTAAS
ncbi:MAG: DUF3048 domain-containing protein [Actinomycetota bacterium]|nr:DUF3048 domain-containing protein [Actinomycetota bacterium]